MMTLEEDAALCRNRDNSFGGFWEHHWLAAPCRHHIAVALLVSAMIAAGFTALTQPSDASTGPAFNVTVNRAGKGDRLPRALPPSASSQRQSGSHEIPKSGERPPLGCEPAFSPVAAPERAGIFGRCAT